MQKYLEKELKIAPSILSGDFANLGSEARKLEEAGADSIHIDIMDGHFVPNLTLGPRAVEAINRSTDLFLDVHLMIYNPFDYIERFVAAGADSITIHFEATEDVEDTLNYIKKCNIRAGLAFNPETSISLIPKYLDKCDMILLMTVNPGFGGQEFIPSVLEKISFTREICEKFDVRGEKNQPFDIQVDGGINLENIAKCRQAGANVFVAGTSIFNQLDLKTAISNLRENAGKST